MARLTQDQKDRIIQTYQSGKSLRETARVIGTRHQTCLKILQHAGVERRSASKSKQKYPINENFFSDINTEEKAYILGFIHADGYVRMTSKDSLVRICLQRRDEDILNKIKLAIGLADKPLYSSSKITKTKGICHYKTLSVNNQRIVSDLYNLGYKSPKTLTIRFPSFVTKDLARHFLRGVVDGDGSISSYQGTSPYINIVGNHLFIKDSGDIFLELLGLCGHIIRVSKNSSRISFFSYIDTLTVCEWLYKDSKIYLDRKYNQYLEVKALCQRKLQNKQDKRLKKREQRNSDESSTKQILNTMD